MEIIRRPTSEIAKKGTVILETKPFIRDFLDIFATEKAQEFVSNNARTDMEWKSVGLYIKLHGYVINMLGYEPSKETMAFYLHTIMTHSKLRRTAIQTLQEKTRVRGNKSLAITDEMFKK